jgi:hypothetical protein
VDNARGPLDIATRFREPSPHHPPPVASTPTHLDPPSAPCRNCGDPTPGTWCPACGQRKAHLRASLGTLLRDLMEDQFGLERRTPRTLFALFFRPGFLTREYLDGRVVRYIQPFKLYLVSSVVLFLLFGIAYAGGIDRIVEGVEVTGAAEESAAVEAGEAGDAAPPAPDEPADTVGTASSPATGAPRLDQLNVQTGNARLDALIGARLARLGRLEPADQLREVLRTFLSHTPTLLFLLLPVFAGVLKLLYIRGPTFYAEHFVFVLHNHAFLFGVFAVGIVASSAGAGFIAPFLFLWAAIYLYLAMRRVYGQSRRKTALKYWTLGWAYFWILVITFPVMVVVSLLLAA